MSQFKALLRQRILTLTHGKSRVKMPRKLKGQAGAYPLADELEYQRYITRTIDAFRGNFLEQVARDLKPVLPTRTRLDAADGWDLALDQLLESQQANFNKDKQQNFLGGLFKFAQNTSDFNSGEWDKFVEGAVGTVFHEDEPWLKGMLDEWAHTNFDLIKSLSDQYIAKANDIVKKAVNEGVIYSEAMSRLQDMDTSITRKKAKLIARDQIGKLNGQLSQKRMEAAEIELYVWETVGDERVRGNPSGRFPKAVPSHYAIDGKICRWDNAGVYRDEKGEWVHRTALMPTSHPGQEILCRCVAIPYMDDIFAEIAASDSTTVAPEPGLPPAMDKALAAVKGLPETLDANGHPYVPMQSFVKSTATPDVFHSSPLPVDSKIILEKGTPKTLYFDHLVSTQPGVSKGSLEHAMQTGWTPEPIKVVKYNGQNFIYGQESHDALARLRLLGDYRGKAIVYDLDTAIAKTATKVPKAPLPKATLPHKPKIVPPATPIAPIPVVKAPKDIALEWLATKNNNVLAIGVPNAPSDWTKPLLSNNVNVGALQHDPWWVPASDIVFAPGDLPEFSWVESMVKDGVNPGTALPKAIKLNGKVHVLSGKAQVLSHVAMAEGDLSTMIQVSLAQGDTAVAVAQKAIQAEIAQAAKTSKAASTAMKAGAKATRFEYYAYVKKLEVIKEKYRQVVAKTTASAKALVKAKEWLGLHGFKDLVEKQYTPKIMDLWKRGKLTPDIVEAMKIYKGNSYEPWNASLRGLYPLSDSHQKLTKELDEYFKHAPPLQEDTRLYRGLGLDWELDPTTDEGRLLFDGGFISTSTDRDTSLDFAKTYAKGQNKYLLVINAKKGSRFTPLVSYASSEEVSYNLAEAEFLGDRSQAFRVIKVHPKGMSEFEGRALPYDNLQVVEVELL